MAGFLESIGLAKPAAQQQQPQGQPQGQQGANAPAQQSPQGQQPNGAPTPNSQVNGTNQQVDPMAAYATMFSNDPNKQGEVAPSFAIDTKVLDQVSGSMDFMQGMNPELMQKAQSGDMNAIMEMMNHVGRQSYRNALQHSSSLTDKFVGMREEFSGKQLPGRVREELTMGQIAGDAGSTSPIVRQQLAEIAKKYQAANPDASPQQVAAAAKKYVADLYNTINPADPTADNKQSPGQGTDWDAYFDATT